MDGIVARDIMPVMHTTLNISEIQARTQAEGPGERFAVWVQGCCFRCKGCCNPEQLEFIEKTRIDPYAFADQAIGAGVEGVSILGGEPFEQALPLSLFARKVRAAGLSVMVYSGYTLQEIESSERPGFAELLSATDLLVDGLFDATQRSKKRRWVGSDNQAMHFLTDFYRQNDPRFEEQNTLEIHIVDGKIHLNGWPVFGAATGRRMFKS